MKFGINLFPTVAPDEKSAATWYEEAIELAVLAEELGFAHVKTVEHYFFPWGGYSPDPVTLLAAIAGRTSRIRLVTGAVIPAFTHPVQLAGKLAMLDNISHGRLDAGFGRAFLPDEFEAFNVPIDSSRERFDQGVEAVRRLWSEEDVVVDTSLFQFGPVTLLPRPFQRPHPPILVAAARSPESCAAAGAAGYGLLLVPSVARRERVQEMLGGYRAARATAGFSSADEHVQMSFSVHLDDVDGERARDFGRADSANNTRKLADAVAAWGRTRSDQYPGYDSVVRQVASTTYEESLRANNVLAGTPDQVREQLETLRSWYGDVTVSLQINSGSTPIEESRRTLRLFAERLLTELSAPGSSTPGSTATEPSASASAEAADLERSAVGVES
ncbi:LLM class flavin-dependent oxidoreductase [Protofrankia symbiont of Coriaria ruscifolia]|uniref:LLM class flavin-dependent oxidoreductase n=1 Tax=Protofrankia symbiont of Coriaria ruscifolia TaxID=1306542 RepID=UPI0010419A0A|nr:LLM class flavin-dependent oxidoreductase [Protofrankia symbiont of Coriaria ruscifolia]